MIIVLFQQDLIMYSSNTPHHPNISIGIVAIKSKAVIQPESFLKCLLRT